MCTGELVEFDWTDYWQWHGSLGWFRFGLVVSWSAVERVDHVNGVGGLVVKRGGVEYTFLKGSLRPARPFWRRLFWRQR